MLDAFLNTKPSSDWAWVSQWPQGCIFKWVFLYIYIHAYMHAISMFSLVKLPEGTVFCFVCVHIYGYIEAEYIYLDLYICLLFFGCFSF